MIQNMYYARKEKVACVEHPVDNKLALEETSEVWNQDSIRSSLIIKPIDTYLFLLLVEVVNDDANEEI